MFPDLFWWCGHVEALCVVHTECHSIRRRMEGNLGVDLIVGSRASVKLSFGSLQYS